MLNVLKYLLLMIMALGLIVGLVSRRQVFRTIGGMIFFPILIAIIYTYGKNIFNQMDSINQLITAAIILFIGILIVLRILFGAQILTHLAGNFIYDILKALFLFPFRIMQKIFHLILRRYWY